MNKTGIIYGVNGPVIYLKGDPGFKISEMVYVGPEKLVGEVIGLKKGMTTVQVFEETTGLKPGDTVIGTGDAISVLLGPGIIHNIFDGIQRPLEEIAKSSGKYISRGVSVDSLDTSIISPSATMLSLPGTPEISQLSPKIGRASCRERV